MALTRAQIRTNVEAFTGKKNKTTEINTFCDLALREAMLRHSFRGSKNISTSLTIVKTNYSKAITSDVDALTDISSIVIKDSSDNESIVEIKNEIWFTKNVGDPSLKEEGRPYYCYRKNETTLVFDRPADKTYTLVIGYSDLTPVFAADSTECPIASLDIFVTYYVCASIYLSIADEKNYSYWMQKAVGTNMEDWQGGAFQAAVRVDTRDSGKEITKMDGVINHVSKPTLYADEYDSTGAFVATKPWYRS